MFNALRPAVVALLALTGIGLGPMRDCGSGSVVVTVDAPAELSRERFRGLALEGELILQVVSYQPAARGTVAVVVRLRPPDGEPAIEIGRFGIFPDAPFKADRPDEAMRFRLALTAEHRMRLADPKTVLVVSLEPAGGTGEGARVELHSLDGV